MKFREPSEYITEEDSKKYVMPFLTSLKSFSTKKEYYGIIQLIADEVKLTVSDWDSEVISSYFKELAKRCDHFEFSYNTYRSRLGAVKRFYAFCCDRYENMENPAEELIMPDAPTRMYSSQMPTLADVDTVLDAVKDDITLYLVFTLVLRMGLTTSELIRLGVSDFIMTENGTLQVVLQPTAKFRHLRYLPLPPDVESVYRSYIALRDGSASEDALLLNKHGKPMAIRTLQHQVLKVLKECGLSRFSLKDFRTRAIFSMLETGCKEEDVSEFAGLSYAGIGMYRRSVPYLVEEKTPASLMNLVVKNPYDSYMEEYGEDVLLEEGDIYAETDPLY